MISKIVEVFPTSTDLVKLLILDQLAEKEYISLVNDFNYGKEHIDKSIKIYRNIAIILSLKKAEESFSNDWTPFIDRHFPKKQKITKLDNVFVSKNYDSILLVTNRRLVTVDLKNINEKIKKINTDIDILNDSIGRETKPEVKKGFMNALKAMFS